MSESWNNYLLIQQWFIANKQERGNKFNSKVWFKKNTDWKEQIAKKDTYKCDAILIKF